MPRKQTFVEEITDPVTGDVVVVEAASEDALDARVDVMFGPAET